MMGKVFFFGGGQNLLSNLDGFRIAYFGRSLHVLVTEGMAQALQVGVLDDSSSRSA